MRRPQRRRGGARPPRLLIALDAHDLANLLQVGVTVGVAVLVAAAAMVGSAASGNWQRALREEIRWAAATTESVSYVYGSEAPLGFRLAAMDELAAQLAAAGVPGSETAMIEERTQRRAAFELRRAHDGSDHLVADGRYRTADGYDVPRRLGDLEEAQAVDASWEATVARADRYRRWAVRLGLAAVLLVLAYPILLALVRGRRRRRGAGGSTREAGIVPDPGTGGRAGLLSWLVFAAWVMITVLPGIQVRSALDEQREQALAGSTAARLSLMIATSSSRSSFLLSSRREAEVVATTGLAREFELVGRGALEAGLLPVARAEQRVRDRLITDAEYMGRTPTRQDGVGPELAAAIGSTRAEWTATLESQQRHARQAGVSGRVNTRLVVATLLAALAFPVGTLAGVAAGRRRTLTALTGALLGLAVLFALAAVT